MSFQKLYPVSAFFVRKEPKKHGAKEQIDGHISDGKEVLIVDDVTTTGQSMLSAIRPIQKKNCSINIALSIVDREEGAAEFLASHGITLYSFFKRGDFRID
jgi:orotate phosphoribosyltransferase